MSFEEGLKSYRKKRKFRYELSKNLEFDKNKLLYYKIQRFFKKKLLFKTVNCLEIEGIYKFHCYMCCVSDKKTRSILDIEEILGFEYKDEELEKQLINMLDVEYEQLIDSFDTCEKIPVLLDLRNFNGIFIFNDKEYKLDKKTRLRFISQQTKIKKGTHIFELLLQTINYSKAMCEIY